MKEELNKKKKKNVSKDNNDNETSNCDLIKTFNLEVFSA